MHRPGFSSSLRWLTCSGLAMLALSLSLPAAAQWKWRDTNGRVTVSDTPPPREVPDKDIIQRPQLLLRQGAAPAPSAVASGAASAPAGDKDLQSRKKAADQQVQDKAKAEEQRQAAVRAENCQRARNHLTTLESGMRIARVNDKGEREILDDNARAQEVQRARAVIASDCR